jgi:hypothetical protein
MVLRLYKVDEVTGKCTGAKRDYPSKEHFIKYGLETYERYDREYYSENRPTGTKAKLCFLNENNKWEELHKSIVEEIIKG